MKQYKIKIKDNTYDVVVEYVDEHGKAKISVNGKEHEVEIIGTEGKFEPSAAVAKPLAAAKSAAEPLAAAKPAATAKPLAAPVATSSSSTASQTAGTAITTPLPGVIIGIKVNIGDKVSAGQTVAVLEAMKMENSIESEVAGTVTAIHVQRGDSVLEGAKIVTVE